MLMFSEEPMRSSHIFHACYMLGPAHPVRFKLFLPQYQKLSSPLCFEFPQFMFFVSTDTVETRYIIHSNENTWTSIYLAAGWIILTQTGCNLNRTIDTARCATYSEQYKENIKFLGTCSEFGAFRQ